MCIMRIAELLDDELVELGLRARDDEVDLLVVLARQLADDARKLLERLPEGGTMRTSRMPPCISLPEGDDRKTLWRRKSSCMRGRISVRLRQAISHRQ